MNLCCLFMACYHGPTPRPPRPRGRPAAVPRGRDPAALAASWASPIILQLLNKVNVAQPPVSVPDGNLSEGAEI